MYAPRPLGAIVDVQKQFDLQQHVGHQSTVANVQPLTQEEYYSYIVCMGATGAAVWLQLQQTEEDVFGPGGQHFHQQFPFHKMTTV